VDDVEKLYQQQILEHHRAPRNAGRLADPTHSAEAHNPLCGDRVCVTLRVGAAPSSAATPTLLEIRCDAQGCSLCRASGSLLTELMTGHGLEQVQAWLVSFLELTRAPASAPLEADAALLRAVAPLLEVRKFPSRRRCVSLSWEALQTALQG
jgi:nitrogen fixation NifU-like protein